MTYIGIDPGGSGAMAMICGDEFAVLSFDRIGYRNLLQSCLWTESVACLELVHAMPGQGVRSMFSFGENYGFIQGLLEACGIPYQCVPPQRWKKAFSLGADKSAAIAVCQKLFPQVDLRKPRGRKPNDGMAEALLMAEYARRNFGR